MRERWLALLCNLQKTAVDLRLVFSETLIMGCILGPISGPRVDDLNGVVVSNADCKSKGPGFESRLSHGPFQKV
jgi:hypothetical protein